jgi:taurine dioxygenase
MNAPIIDTMENITVTKLCPTIGVEIGGIDLRNPLSSAMREHIRALFVAHKVLFFRDQRMERQHQLSFASNFGPVEAYDSGLNVEGYREIVRIDNGLGIPKIPTNTWHTDASFMEKPSMGAVLRAIEVPDVGGDTLFADMAAAYDGLPEAIKKEIDGLVAMHDGRKAPEEKDYDAEWYRSHTSKFPRAEHPVVMTHPESGRKILYVNTRYTTEIKGLPKKAGDELLAYLCSKAAVPEYQVRFKWRVGSVAFWDNRSTQHYASADYGNAVRRMERIGIAEGDFHSLK